MQRFKGEGKMNNKSQHKENFKLIIPFFDKSQAKRIQKLLEGLVIGGERYFIMSYIEAGEK